MAGPFELALSQFAQKAGDNADQVVKEVVLEVASRLIVRSPVDTGRFRSNWFYSLGSADPTITGAVGAASLQGAGDLPTKAAGQVHWIQNNLPYAQRLEGGWSKQAPNGMVALTVIEFEGIVDKAAQEVNP